MRPHISYSELVSFANECKWKWKLEYLDGNRSQIYSIHFDFGTAIHEALEKHLTRTDPLTVEGAIAVFRSRFENLVEKHREKYNKPPDVSGLLAAGENIVRRLNECQELAEAEVVHNEYPLFEPIHRDDGADIKFKGYIDLVIKTKDKRGKPILYVCDFKTCSWGWDRETREDRWKQYQLFLYKYFLCKKFDIDPKQVRTAFVLLKKRPPRGECPIEFFPVSAGPISVQRALDQLGSTITEMVERERAGTLEKDRSFCTNKFGETCPFYKTPLCP